MERDWIDGPAILGSIEIYKNLGSVKLTAHLTGVCDGPLGCSVMARGLKDER